MIPLEYKENERDLPEIAADASQDGGGGQSWERGQREETPVAEVSGSRRDDVARVLYFMGFDGHVPAFGRTLESRRVVASW
jgi:phage-related protein